MSDATDRYAVIGHPVGHSKSPRIHAAFAEQTGERLTYEAIEAPLEGFAETVRGFFAADGRGLNVTVPFKEQACALADTRSPAAERAGAVNTLARVDGITEGHNTDGIGLVRDLTVNQGIGLAERTILVVGAGGAVRGILEPLLAAGPARVVIANRTAERATELAGAFAELGPVEGCGLETIPGHPFDLVINGTAASLEGRVPPLPEAAIGERTAVYDMVYADRPTAFMDWAREHGAALAVDGLGMLVEQAAESFFIWRGVRPRTGPVIAALREDG